MRGSDELIGLGWSESSEAASHWFDTPGSWAVEGVVMPRALRKWLARNPEGQPAEAAIYLGANVVDRTKYQSAMATGCTTVWNAVRGELARRGVHLLEFNL